MKIEKKLWITLFAFGIFAICFSGWIFSQSTTREKLFWDNTIQCETKELAEGEIKSENIALPEDFDIPDPSYLKPPTPLQKFGWMEKKYMNTEMKRMLRAL